MKETINSFIELGDKVIEQEEEIEKLTNELDREKSKVKEYGTRLLKAIEYLESYNTDFKNCRFGEAPISIRELGDLLDILKGEDKK